MHTTTGSTIGHTMTPRRRRARQVAAGLTLGATALSALALGACAGSDDETSNGIPAHDVGESEASGEVVGDTSGAGTDVIADDGSPPQAIPAGELAAAVTADRKQTFTATVRLDVDGLEDAVRSAGAAIEALGGFASGEDVDLGDARRATITYRVPSEQFRSALDALSEVGDLQSQEVRGSDVTATYADLEGRVTTLRTSITRLQGFLAEASDANQVASLEGELTRREGELESVESQRRALADQVELSTITVSFDAATADAPVDDDRTLPSFLGGLESGWDALVAGGAVVLAAVGFLLPFAPLVVALALGLRWWARRRHEPQAA